MYSLLFQAGLSAILLYRHCKIGHLRYVVKRAYYFGGAMLIRIIISLSLTDMYVDVLRIDQIQIVVTYSVY